MVDAEAIHEIVRWLIGGGRPLGGPRSIVGALCDRLIAAGVPIERMAIFVKSIHPHLIGRRLMWRPDTGVDVMEVPHAMAEQPEFRASVAVAVIDGGETIRTRLAASSPPWRFPTFAEFKAEGVTDHLIYPLVYTDGQTHAASFATKRPEGFDDDQIAALMAIQAPLARVTEAYVLRLDAARLLSLYVGRNAGRRVLEGRIRLGDRDEIDAVVLFCDLVGFTAFAETHGSAETIARLNAFHGHVVTAIEAAGGEVLKFLGDGLLAIFPITEAGEAEAARRASAAVTNARAAIAAADDAPRFRAALHAGTVSYGNIGGGKRLDFTAIGPAVNLAARLVAKAGDLGLDTVCSERIAAHLDGSVAVGTHALKGIADPATIFVLDRGTIAGAARAT